MPRSSPLSRPDVARPSTTDGIDGPPTTPKVCKNTCDGVRSLLLLEHIASEAPQNPLVQPSEDGAILFIPEVTHPSWKASIQIVDHPLHVTGPSPQVLVAPRIPQVGCCPRHGDRGGRISPSVAATPYPSRRSSLLLAPHDLGLPPLQRSTMPAADFSWSLPRCCQRSDQGKP
jgi:hypothetical protein